MHTFWQPSSGSGHTRGTGVTFKLAAVEVFEGNTADPTTVRTQLETLRERFALSRVVLVGDRGLPTGARIREEVRPAGFDRITALRAPQIRALVDGGDLQLSLFDERDLAEISAPESYPGERLVVCRNPLLAAKRARKRQELLAATEVELDKVVAAVCRDGQPLRGRDKIAVRADRALRRYKVGKHFDVECTDDSFSWARNEGRIAKEAALDGIYIIRTDVPAETLSPEEGVRSYKSLSKVERAFRSYKTVDLEVRPVHHRLEGRVRAHVFPCMIDALMYVKGPVFWKFEAAGSLPTAFRDLPRGKGHCERRASRRPVGIRPAAR